MLQLNSPLFLKHTRLFFEGLKPYLVYMSYNSVMFLTKRIIRIPGYQLNIDSSKESNRRQLFTFDELQELQEKFQNTPGFEFRRNLVFDGKMHILKTPQADLTEDEYNLQLNDNKFHELTFSDRIRVKIYILTVDLCNNSRLFKKFYEFATGLIFFTMKKHAQKLKH